MVNLSRQVCTELKTATGELNHVAIRWLPDRSAGAHCDGPVGVYQEARSENGKLTYTCILWWKGDKRES